MLSLNGDYMEIHTPQMEVAKSLIELYHALNITNITTTQRIDLLRNVRGTVINHQSIVGVTELLKLIDRECDLISRNRPIDTLRGLRQRISNLYLQFVNNPMINTQSEQFSHVPSDSFISQHNALMRTQQIQSDKSSDQLNNNTDTIKYGRADLPNDVCA